MSTFFKYCPMCEAENQAIASFCEQCDGDLLNVPATPRPDVAEPAPESAANQAPAAVNPASTAKPTPASQRPAGIAPIVRGPNQEAIATRHAASYQPSLRLELIQNPALSFEIKAGQTVGRAAKADVVLNGVPDLDFISRAHARFLHRRGQWYVQYIAEGNFIKVDGSEYTDDSEVAIYEDSVVVLSLTAFRVRLG